MLREGLLLLYCAAVGFVAAGTAASFYKLITLQPARFTLLGQGWGGLVATFVFCALTGPAIMMDLVIHQRLTERGSLSTIFGGLVVAALWSAVSGILVLDLVISVAGGLA